MLAVMVALGLEASSFHPKTGARADCACRREYHVVHTLKYGHLDSTSDHPTQGIRAPSTPRPVALCNIRSDLRALAHQQD